MSRNKIKLYPQVPPILYSGDHKKIKDWKEVRVF